MSKLKIYNTYSNIKEDFIPLDESNIRMYVCGPTVYNEIHVGNARSILVFDLLFRVLKREYKTVTYVRNITDIDDKIINRAKEEGTTSDDVSKFWTQRFKENYTKLNVLEPTHQPCATETVNEILEAIGELIENGFAYVQDATIFFKVSELESYGKLSKQNNVLDGARVSANELKDDQRDFVLWKPSKSGEPYWNSVYGKGRPGWHIECTAMSSKFLGEQFDIHGGGQDLIFPHHENEQAQNIGLFGEAAGPKYWMHNAMIVLDDQKMSKSLGNIVLLADALEKYDADLIRFFILGTHYRHKLIWDDENIEQFATRFTRIVFNLQPYLQKNAFNVIEHDIDEDVYAALLNDLNCPEAFAIFEEKLTKAISENNSQLMQKLANTLTFLGFSFKQNQDLIFQLEVKLRAREAARKARDYAMADKIRKEIQEYGYDVADMSNCSVLKKMY